MNKPDAAIKIDMKNSTIYKSLRKSVRKEDHKELLRMLEIVMADKISAEYFDKDEYALSDSFYWHLTLQGSEYWLELSDRIREAGHDNY